MKHPSTTYRGVRLCGPAGEVLGVTVVVDGRPLSTAPSRRIRDHSPTGFEWGYGGSGPSQLALALLLDATGDADVAERCYHWFKWATVAGWGTTWTITAGEISRWVERWQHEVRQREDLAAGILPYVVGPTSNLVGAAAVAPVEEGGVRHG